MQVPKHWAVCRSPTSLDSSRIVFLIYAYSSYFNFFHSSLFNSFMNSASYSITFLPSLVSNEDVSPLNGESSWIFSWASLSSILQAELTRLDFVTLVADFELRSSFLSGMVIFLISGGYSTYFSDFFAGLSMIDLNLLNIAYGSSFCLSSSLCGGGGVPFFSSSC